ncbi:MAG: hypothetical protein JXA03_09800, partial [Bacteroidales bacterium]|nr:hypothetical protein [Bacteroidales bacterium]
VSDQFFLLPKNNMGLSLNSLLQSKFTAIYSGTDTLKGKYYETVKVIPEATDSDVVIAILWINPSTYEIQKTEITSKSAGTYTVDFWYNNASKPLPSMMEITFDVGKLTLPVKFLGYDDTDQENKKNPLRKEGQGSIMLRFSDYDINKGIDDSFFEKEE